LDANILQNLDNAKYLNEINIIIGQIILKLELFVPFYKAKKVDLHSTNPPFSLYK